MKKKIYYVVEKELEQFSNFEEPSGNKEVRVYDVEKGIIKPWFSLDLENEDNSQEEIIDYLINNGHIEESTESAEYSVYYDELEFMEL